MKSYHNKRLDKVRKEIIARMLVREIYKKEILKDKCKREENNR